MSSSRKKLDHDLPMWEGKGSPFIRLINARYRRLGLDVWSNKKIAGLSRYFGVSVRELCAFAGLDAKQTKAYWDREKWPVSVALHFAMLESLWAKRTGLKDFLVRDKNTMEVFLRNLKK